MNKYRNVPVTIDNIKFPSKREGMRYQQLKLLERAGEISCLELQKPFQIFPRVKYDKAEKATPAVRYFADFYYVDTKTGKHIIEDVKGFETPVFKLKRQGLKALYGLDITIIK